LMTRMGSAPLTKVTPTWISKILLVHRPRSRSHFILSISWKPRRPRKSTTDMRRTTTSLIYPNSALIIQAILNHGQCIPCDIFRIPCLFVSCFRKFLPLHQDPQQLSFPCIITRRCTESDTQASLSTMYLFWSCAMLLLLGTAYLDYSDTRSILVFRSLMLLDMVNSVSPVDTSMTMTKLNCFLLSLFRVVLSLSVFSLCLCLCVSPHLSTTVYSYLYIVLTFFSPSTLFRSCHNTYGKYFLEHVSLYTIPSNSTRI